MSKKTYEIGDTIEWDNVPRNGTMIRQGRNYATRIGDDGTWNHVDGDPAWWPCRGAGWQWALNGSGAVTIVALDLTGEESAGDLRKRAEIFEVREALRTEPGLPGFMRVFIGDTMIGGYSGLRDDALQQWAKFLHAVGWRPGDSAERAAELLAWGTR